MGVGQARAGRGPGAGRNDGAFEAGGVEEVLDSFTTPTRATGTSGTGRLERHQSVRCADRCVKLSAVATESRDALMKVYGITEIARALDTDPGLVGKWRERHKLPAPDAELATGPVWLAGTIEPLLAAGGPEPRVPGQRLHTFQVTARMIAGPYPALTNDRRSNFQAAIAAIHRTDYLKPPAARWDMLNEAVVTIECEAHES